ncbi:S49 family peptidase [Aquabacterium sp.]|jgi:protease-4|uniref:S49 family peptidase n=1 Tax=Aquabacterium sp. TaxID=1872578 RepID=UPI0011D6C824|nr:S49 family peptidase [Aquabacterium sp.]MBP6614661.1 S49 family peptidase [Aquabacterium sp.]MDD2975315.1 S49 family peptidase [Aquabacterium sp.]TXI96284.1 MAG: S49 family peptidase [Aquabacterium sp.]
MSADDPRKPDLPTATENALLTQFARAYLQQQRSEQRWRWFWRLVWLFVAASIIWGTIQTVPSAKAPVTAHTALVEVRGVIATDAEANADNLMAALRSAFEDHGARAVILRINSPGGSPVQAGLVHDEIVRLKALHKKKIYAVCEEMCASAAYYIAAAADQVVVDKASVVGSIGVLMDGFGFTGVMEKIGVERRLMTSGSNKGMLDPFSPRDPIQETYAQAMLDQIHQQFISVVKSGRGKRLQDNPELFSGLFWNGEQAVSLGLADRLGSLDQIARDEVKAEDIIDYTQKENLAERLAKRFGAAIGAGAVQAMRESVHIR